MWAAWNYSITVVEMLPFSRAAEAVWDEDELGRLTDYLAFNPEAGDVIPGTGGVRKLRWGYSGKGKRGGARVIYYFRDLNMPIYLLALYKKGEKDTLNQKEKKMMELYVAELVRAHSRRWLRIVNESSA